MAFAAKDGTMHTNADSMRSRNAMSSAPAPQDPAQGEDQNNIGELKQEFDGVLQALQSGQKPDPEAAKAICEFLEQFTSGAEGSGENEQSEEPWGKE